MGSQLLWTLATDGDWQTDLERWLAPYLEGLGNKRRRRMCPAYIAGLIGPGDRKSIQPTAARSEAIAYDRLHHFIGAGLWDSAPLEATLWSQADELVGGDGAWLIITRRTPCRRRARHRSASLRSTPRHWARTRTARRWYR